MLRHPLILQDEWDCISRPSNEAIDRCHRYAANSYPGRQEAMRLARETIVEGNLPWQGRRRIDNLLEADKGNVLR